MSGTAHPNHVRLGLAARRFVLTIEVATPPASEPLDQAIRPILAFAADIRHDPRIDAIALTDRSRSDEDHDSLVVAQRVAEASGKVPIVHWAGKDRTETDLDRDLRRAEAWGLQTLLLVTGDRIRKPPAHRPVRYLDSVNALIAARRWSAGFLLAAAVSPFKYREEELVNQYLKALKKLRAGADVLMTQIGWDMRKYDELRRVLQGRGDPGPLMAELLLLTPSRCRFIRRHGLAGVTITDDLAQRLEDDASAPDGGRALAFRRLALQIAAVRHLGYAGVQVSGVHTYPDVVRLLDEVEEVTRAYPTEEARAGAWHEHLTHRNGRPVRVVPTAGERLIPSSSTGHSDDPVPARRPGSGEWLAFRTMEFIHRAFFTDGAIGSRVLGPALQGADARSKAGRVLVHLERATKGPLVGCRTCGFCRLPYTAYVCPETCPKGLANGPCGGTKDNVCEFGDRECIHNRIYRIARQAGELSTLAELVIPPVPEPAWGSCSWVAHFRGAGPAAGRLHAWVPRGPESPKDAGGGRDQGMVPGPPRSQAGSQGASGRRQS